MATIDDLRKNQAAWTGWADDYVGPAEANWAGTPVWGVFSIDEAEVGVLPDALDGKDVIELGCGTGYVSAWMARRGARPVGIDPTAAQLATARRLQRQHDLHFPLIQAGAERVPLRSASFDVAISEYGAAIWSDPYAWIPEAARLLRPGGELIFLGNSLLMMLCTRDEEGVPATNELRRPQFGMHRFDWDEDPPTVEFHLPHGEWIRLLREHGFEVTDLIEVQAPPDATTWYDFVTADWAHQWPCEEVWKARKRD